MIMNVFATATVLAVIKRSRKGVDVATLRNKTGFEGRKISCIVQRFKRGGKIKSGGRGIYVKAQCLDSQKYRHCEFMTAKPKL